MRDDRFVNNPIRRGRVALMRDVHGDAVQPNTHRVAGLIEACVADARHHDVFLSVSCIDESPVIWRISGSPVCS
jgi:hypothetical protein